jgi:hypothetical protein
MTPHDHREYVDGCYRCELSREVVADAIALLVSKGIDTIEKYDALIAAIDAPAPELRARVTEETT